EGTDGAARRDDGPGGRRVRPGRRRHGARAGRCHGAARAALAALHRHAARGRGVAAGGRAHQRRRGPARALRALLPPRRVPRRRPPASLDVLRARGGPLPLLRDDGHAADRVRERPLRQHVRDRPRLRDGRRDAARGRAGVPRQLLGRVHGRGARALAVGRRRAPRQRGRGLGRDGGRRTARGRGPAEPRAPAVPGVPGPEHRRRPHGVLLHDARIGASRDRVGHLGRRDGRDARDRRGVPGGRRALHAAAARGDRQDVRRPAAAV
ncbi:MAG: hypothetical protein AVDCRST_MAG79-2715, partial [uncultured Thermoleophilia bacterium]